MSRYFNRHYSYRDMDMWEHSSWADRREEMSAIDDIIDPMIVEYRKKNPIREYYPDRHDEILSQDRHVLPYFQDVVDAWRKKGMVYSCEGMMSLTMMPLSVVERRNNDPKVLYIPEVLDQANPHFAMNFLKEYEEVLENCAREEIVVEIMQVPIADRAHIMITEKVQELQGTFRIELSKVYYDLTLAMKLGFTLDRLPDREAFGPLQTLAGAPVVDITGKWIYHQAHEYLISNFYLDTVPQWDYQRHIHTEVGKEMAESMRIEHDYTSPDDPALLEHWKRMGIRYEMHYYDNEQWATFTPESAFEDTSEKLPLLCIFKEPRKAAPFMLQTGIQFYYDFIELAAQGNFMCIIFAMESAEDNEMYLDIIDDAIRLYPIDETRIYATGQSHNGYYCQEFYRRHADRLAAIAALADPLGLRLGATLKNWDCEEYADTYQGHDMPFMCMIGEYDHGYTPGEPGSETERKYADYIRRRLKAYGCPEPTTEEIIALKQSKNIVDRMNLVPADHTEVRYVMGNEVYVSDIRDKEGNYRMRLCTIENLPHMISPQMANLAWEFMRRFARDPETGRTVELY